MKRRTKWLCAMLCLSALILVLGRTASAQTSTTEVKHFQIVSVDGNKVVVKGEKGAQEITVPDDFKLTVDGKDVTVHDLKPGMKGTAKITTTTTVTPVYVTEVRNGEVMKVVGNSIIVRVPEGVKMFSEGDVAKRNVKIIKGGHPVEFTDLHVGDKLSATIVTEGPPKVMTQRQVQAALTSAPAAGAGASAGLAVRVVRVVRPRRVRQWPRPGRHRPQVHRQALPRRSCRRRRARCRSSG